MNEKLIPMILENRISSLNSMVIKYEVITFKFVVSRFEEISRIPVHKNIITNYGVVSYFIIFVPKPTHIR